MNKRLALTFFSILFCTGCWIISVFWLRFTPKTAPEGPSLPESHVASETDVSSETAKQTDKPVVSEKTSIPNTLEPSRPIGDVPFTVQAPDGAWNDPILQDGCEEASLLMAMAWLGGEELPEPARVTAMTRELADFENERFGHHEDVSLPELVTVLREHYTYEDAIILQEVAIGDLVRELGAGNIILTPSFGQALGNPHFTVPGPITHMLVMIGYDPETREFIVHDPGTRHGADYRYDEDILFDAIWAYPSGRIHPEPPTPDMREKSVLVISR